MSRSQSNDIALITPTIVTSAGAYANNDNIGGLITLENAVRAPGGGGIVESFCLVDKAKQAADMELVLFTEDPTGSTLTDNAAEGIVDADAAKILAVLPIASADWTTFTNLSVVLQKTLNIAFVLPAAASDLYAAIISGGTPTYGATDALELRIGIIGD